MVQSGAEWCRVVRRGQSEAEGGRVGQRGAEWGSVVQGGAARGGAEKSLRHGVHQGRCWKGIVLVQNGWCSMRSCNRGSC